MRWFVPLVLLAALFAAGCATPEEDFMAGNPLPAKAPAPVAPQNPPPAKTNTLTITPALTIPKDPEPAATKTAPMPAPARAPMLPVIVTPDDSLAGKVLAYNSPGHFVVLEFPAGRMPQVDQGLFLYRAGLKVAEVKITGPERENNTVADVISGDAQAGDEVRDQ
jgi:hypothetical protein